MRLLFDLGNTRVKWALEKSERLSNHGILAHAELNEASLDLEFPLAEAPSSVWLSSVAPESQDKVIEAWVRKRFDLAVNRVGVTEMACGIKNEYADLSQLGVDRWLAALGARKFFPEDNVIIIDAGTAITIDVLSSNDSYLGGAILPGAFLMHDSLISRTAGIASRFVNEVQLIGNTTQECVNSGVHHGLVGAVDRVVFQMCDQLSSYKENVVIHKLITGGDAELITRNTTIQYRCVEDLVLHGLLAIADGDR